MKKLQYSKAEERIRCMARLVGVDYSKKTLNNVKRFLEIYSAIKTSLNLIPVSSSPNIIKDEAPELFEAMIMSEEMSDDRIEHFIVALVKTGNMEDMIEQALDKVCAFGKDGKLYETILRKMYFDDVIYLNYEVEKSCYISHGTYYRKKDQAIMLFGISFWSLLISEWQNPEMGIRKLEEKHGRDNRLSDGMKNFDE